MIIATRNITYQLIFGLFFNDPLSIQAYYHFLTPTFLPNQENKTSLEVSKISWYLFSWMDENQTFCGT